MAIQKSEGIVLGRQDLRETSLITTFYTKDFGKIKGIVRGVRGPHAQYGGGSLEIFAHDEVVFYERKKSDIYTISQCDLIDYFNPVRESLDRLVFATYMIELLDSVTSLADKNSEVFELLLNSLKLLSGQSSAKRVTRIFEIKLLHLLGLMPTMELCANCSGKIDSNAKFSFRNGGVICKNCLSTDKEASHILAGTVKFIEHIRNSPFEKVARVKVSSMVGEELEKILRKFLDYHIERRLKTVDFLKEVERVW
ncbi:MAG: DNA repair protein RecO [Candidatus Omnitrophica bacterium]|nr:DNA repair protein RecO [Candidatus Omnitrophota bacterium]